MDRAEIAKTLGRSHDLSEAKAYRIVNDMIELIENAVRAGERVTFRGFGTFKKANRKARKGRNPQTGKKIDIPAKSKMVFKATKTLRDIK